MCIRDRAHISSLLGLRAAVLDLDLMFGNLYDLLGVDAPVSYTHLDDAPKKKRFINVEHHTVCTVAPVPCFQMECFG